MECKDAPNRWELGIDILGLCETHMIGKETLLSKDEYTILLSNRADGMCREGVGIMISQHMTHCLESYDTVSSRLMTAKFNMKEGTLNIIQVYAPTSSYSEEDSDAFYQGAQGTPHDLTFVRLGYFGKVA